MYRKFHLQKYTWLHWISFWLSEKKNNQMHFKCTFPLESPIKNRATNSTPTDQGISNYKINWIPIKYFSEIQISSVPIRLLHAFLIFFFFMLSWNLVRSDQFGFLFCWNSFVVRQRLAWEISSIPNVICIFLHWNLHIWENVLFWGP